MSSFGGNNPYGLLLPEHWEPRKWIVILTFVSPFMNFLAGTWLFWTELSKIEVLKMYGIYLFGYLVLIAWVAFGVSKARVVAIIVAVALGSVAVNCFLFIYLAAMPGRLGGSHDASLAAAVYWLSGAVASYVVMPKAYEVYAQDAQLVSSGFIDTEKNYLLWTNALLWYPYWGPYPTGIPTYESAGYSSISAARVFMTLAAWVAGAIVVGYFARNPAVGIVVGGVVFITLGIGHGCWKVLNLLRAIIKYETRNGVCLLIPGWGVKQ